VDDEDKKERRDGVDVKDTSERRELVK